MRKVIALVLMSLMLVGCVGNRPIQQPPGPTIIHPEWPSPVSPYRFDWEVLVDGERVFVGMEYNQSLDFRLFLEDMNRYIKESNNIICFYRKDIDDVRCVGVDKP